MQGMINSLFLVKNARCYNYYIKFECSFKIIVFDIAANCRGLSMGRMPKREGTDANYPDRIFPAFAIVSRAKAEV